MRAMRRCPECHHLALDQVDYLESDLWGRVIRVIVTFCEMCGWAERTTSEAVPAPV